jgi:hypothetical protein
MAQQCKKIETNANEKIQQKNTPVLASAKLPQKT